MKKAKLRKEFVAAQEAHKSSSAEYRELSTRTAEARKVLKERKRACNAARRTYKTVRKAYRELADELKNVRQKHLQNNDRLRKLSKKMAKTESSSRKIPKKKAAAKVNAKKRSTPPKKLITPVPAEPAITVVS